MTATPTRELLPPPPQSAKEFLAEYRGRLLTEADERVAFLRRREILGMEAIRSLRAIAGEKGADGEPTKDAVMARACLEALPK